MEFDALSSRGFDSWRSLGVLLELYWNPIRVLLVVSDSFSWDEMFDWISWKYQVFSTPSGLYLWVLTSIFFDFAIYRGGLRASPPGSSTYISWFYKL